MIRRPPTSPLFPSPTLPPSTAAQANQPLSPALLVQQNNAQGQIGGPFLNSLPTLPAGWTGKDPKNRVEGKRGGPGGRRVLKKKKNGKSKGRASLPWESVRFTGID